MAVIPSDIKYVKNVNDISEFYSLPYGQYLVGAEFELAFTDNPPVQPANARKLVKDDIVLLFQNPKASARKAVGKWRLTHLVRVLGAPVHTVSHKTPFKHLLKVKVVGKIPDGIEITKTTLDSILNLTKVSNGGNACELKTASKGTSNLTPDEVLRVQERIVEIFKIAGELER